MTHHEAAILIARYVLAWHSHVGAARARQEMEGEVLREYLGALESFRERPLRDVPVLLDLADEQTDGAFAVFSPAPIEAESWGEIVGGRGVDVPRPESLGEAGSLIASLLRNARRDEPAREAFRLPDGWAVEPSEMPLRSVRLRPRENESREHVLREYFSALAQSPALGGCELMVSMNEDNDPYEEDAERAREEGHLVFDPASFGFQLVSGADDPDNVVILTLNDQIEVGRVVLSYGEIYEDPRPSPERSERPGGEE